MQPSTRQTQASADVGAIIDEMVRRLVARFDPEKVILFGSRARGDARPDSDVDLLVVMPVTAALFRMMTQMRSEVHGLGLPTDIVILSSDQLVRFANVSGTISFAATHEGKYLYERSETAD